MRLKNILLRGRIMANDYLGQTLNVGDLVAFSLMGYSGFFRGKIESINLLQDGNCVVNIIFNEPFNTDKAIYRYDANVIKINIQVNKYG